MRLLDLYKLKLDRITSPNKLLLELRLYTATKTQMPQKRKRGPGISYSRKKHRKGRQVKPFEADQRLNLMKSDQGSYFGQAVILVFFILIVKLNV